jgi:outer membrane receptor protein involved in Fe transport
MVQQLVICFDFLFVQPFTQTIQLMKKFLMKGCLLMPGIFLTACCFAQNTVQSFSIKGIAVDSATLQPMSYVTVVLQNSKSGRSIKSAVTKSDGSFLIKATLGNSYNLVLSFVGYANKNLSISSGASDTDAGSISMVRSVAQLKAVSINAVKPIVTREVDKLNYDVQADPEVASLSVLDMMRKVPLLAVDGDDHLLLNGGGNYKILINGKESAMMARNPSDVLKVMPATNIEKIEVITTPPAKYDAEGLTGIINIITKKNGDQGYTIGINGGYNTVNGPTGSLSGTFKKGKFGMALFTFFGYQKNQVTSSNTTENIISNNNTIFQNSVNSRHAPLGDGGVDLSYEFDSLHLLTGSIGIFQQTTYTRSNQSSTIDSTNILQQGYHLSNTSSEKYMSVDAGVNYQLGFKRSKNELLTFSYHFNNGPDEKLSNNNFSNRFNYDAAFFPDYQQSDSEGITTNTVQVDFTSPLNKQLTIEAGAKAIFRDDFSNYHEDDLDSTTNKYILNDRQTNIFKYLQNVYSLYNSYQLKLGKWTGKGGLRLEHTAVNADFSSEGVSIAPSYNNLIPSISLQRNFSVASLNFGYTQRIQRPGISQLSPYVNQTNPLFVFTGNPSLRPELDNNFEFTYNRFGKNSIVAGATYSFSDNSIQRVSSLRIDSTNNVNDTVNYNTYGNLGVNRTFGLNLSTRFNFSQAFFVGINSRISRIWLKGNYNGNEYSNQGYFGNAFIFSRYKFQSGLAIGLNAGYFSGGVSLQGHSEGRYFSQCLISQDLLKKKATITFVIANSYSKYLTLKSVSDGPDFSQVSNNQVYYRNLSIRFNYRFGKLNSEIKKNQRGINNDDLKGNDTNSGGN